MIIMEHSQIILETIQKKGISSYKVAKDLGISESLFSKWRSRPTSDVSSSKVVLIADYLGCSVDHLLGRDAEERDKSPGMEDSMLRDEQERELIRIARELDPVQKAWLLRLVETAVEREGTRRSQASLDAVRG